MAFRWSPDTCECKFILSAWGVVQKVENKCEHHQHLADANLFDEVYLSENKVKNDVLGLIQKNLLVNIDHEREYDWSFEKTARKKRKLIASFTIKNDTGVVVAEKLTPLQKSTLQTLCDDTFGANRVEVT